MAASTDPLQADIARLREAGATTSFALAIWPGLRKLHLRLCQAMLAARPARRLPPAEAAIEAAVVALLGGPSAPDDMSAMLDPAVPLETWKAGNGYKPFLPVPLWGEVVAPRTASPRAASPQDAEGGPAAPSDGKRRRPPGAKTTRPAAMTR